MKRRYAVACTQSPEWCWFERHSARLGDEGDRNVRLIRTGMRHRTGSGWMLYARDSTTDVDISLAFAPPRGAPVRYAIGPPLPSPTIGPFFHLHRRAYPRKRHRARASGHVTTQPSSHTQPPRALTAYYT
jgi:hypothetical protein